MAQSKAMIVLLCATLALNGVAASSRGQARQLTAAGCSYGCSTLLGSAANYAVVAAQTVSNNGATFLVGDFALTPGNSISGFPPGNITGTTYIGNNANAEQAQGDALTAFNTLNTMEYPANHTLSGVDLVGQTLTAGKYFFSQGAHLSSGNLTFDAQGNHSAIFVIQTTTTFVTDADAMIVLANGAKSCNVFFAVGTSAVIFDRSSIKGSIIAAQSITFYANVVMHGVAAALQASVTLAADTITSPATCTPHPHSSPAPM